jgi:hypothetical protein
LHKITRRVAAYNLPHLQPTYQIQRRRGETARTAQTCWLQLIMSFSVGDYSESTCNSLVGPTASTTTPACKDNRPLVSGQRDLNSTTPHTHDSDIEILLRTPASIIPSEIEIEISDDESQRLENETEQTTSDFEASESCSTTRTAYHGASCVGGATYLMQLVYTSGGRSKQPTRSG